MATSTPITPLRVLVTGHVDGNVGQLLYRVNTLGKKTPFDFLLITGDLFPIDQPLNGYDTTWITEMQADDVKYQNLPPSIYAMGPRHESQRPFFRLLMAASNEPIELEELAFKQGFDSLDGKLTILGSKGIMTCSGSGSGSGMIIVYFSGDENDGRTYQDLDDLLMMKNVQASTIDILMTSSWPKSIHNLSSAAVPADIILASDGGSQLVTDLVLNLKPRYHFAASPKDLKPESSSPGIYFERQPYRNHVMLQEANKPVTRFISLASVPGPDGPKKGPKWLYAFNIKPASDLLSHDKESNKFATDGTKNVGKKELCNQPEDTTQPPFALSIRRDKKSDDRNVQFFYSNENPEESGRGRRGRGRGGHDRGQGEGDRRRRFEENESGDAHQDKRRRNSPAFDTSQCWFCFSSPSVDKSLVVSIGDHAYLATAKGGLVPDHLLILPIEHIRSSLESPNQMLIDEINKFKTALSNYFRSKDKIVAFFERNFKSNHMQIQVVPMPKECLQDNQGKLNQEMLSLTIKQLISENDLDCEQLTDEEQLSDVINPGVPFFYFEITEIKIKLLIRIEIKNRKEGDNEEKRQLFPLQLGRVILAQVMGLDDESIVDWKSVASKLDSEQESKRTAEFRTNFEPFDFTIDPN